MKTEGIKLICINQKNNIWFIRRNNTWESTYVFHNQPDGFYETDEYITHLDKDGKEKYNILYIPNFADYIDINTKNNNTRTNMKDIIMR